MSMDGKTWADRIESHGVAVEWENIGEGKSGDYDPDDPDDVAYLRFYVQRQSDEDPSGWEDVDDASCCTLVPVDTDAGTRMDLLELILDVVWGRVRNGDSIKKVCERLSWIEPSWAKKSTSDVMDIVRDEY